MDRILRLHKCGISLSNIKVVTHLRGICLFLFSCQTEGLGEELRKLKAKTTNKFLRKLKGGTQLPTHSWASEGTHKDTLTNADDFPYSMPTRAHDNTQQAP